MAFSPIATAIINGTKTTSLEYAFIAAIISNNWFGNSMVCGDSVVGSRTILTAAHCLDGNTPSSFTVRVGSADYTTGGKLLNIQKITIYPSYSTNTIDHDYAIIHLADTVVDGSVTATALPGNEINPDDTSGVPVRLAG
ncbi:trypsin-like cysteine/serine peptidase domain-containing protein [Penicillium vulpinum]|uniref:Peptidase S1 domain-containing protein n=1 Tax=Penicillium vulpinum TaxID=29845 RepID=A0A1V6RAQ9_9EURO|nr:trypsin-like cysteine/serine peptidase domain-containing protein [Penicillium vulpinum]KAJ5951051.1 trypsin-like cysteine/serine peptidase domain-containing protein [Penicillium vulpinum]OQD98645.1 hypothetical protein PENVUL_c069G08672 [Penicillium vulpinum]